MNFAAFNEYMICEDPIREYKAAGISLGYEFAVRYPTYRGAYICNIMEMDAAVDDLMIPEENIRFGVNNKWFTRKEMLEANKEYWFTGEKALIRILSDKPLEKGAHKVYLKMVHKIPYTGFFGNYLHIPSDYTRTLTLN